VVPKPPNKAAAQIVPAIRVTMFVWRPLLIFCMTALPMFATLLDFPLLILLR
jgi:hypothetical protein